MNASRGLLVCLLSIMWCGPVRAEADPAPAPVSTRLAKQLRDAARTTYETTWTNYREGRVPGELVYRWSRRWLKAERQLSDKPADQLAAFQAHRDRMQKLEALVERVHRAGQTTVDEVSAAEYYRVEADLWLAQARERQKGR
jgi:hypothetical protein